MAQICNLEYRYQFIMPPILLPRIFMLIGGKEQKPGRGDDLETKGQRASPGGSPGPALTKEDRQSTKADQGSHGGSQSNDSFLLNFTHHASIFVSIHATQLNSLFK